MTIKQLEKILTTLIIMSAWGLALLSGTTGLWSYQALTLYMETNGWGIWGQVLSASGGLAVTTIYSISGNFLIQGIAPLPPKERRKAIPAIIVMMILITGASSYPQFQMAAQGTALELEDRAYIKDIATLADGVKKGVLQFSGLKALLANGAATMDRLERDEMSGKLSGFGTGRPGAVSSWIGAKTVRLRQAENSIGNANSKAGKITVRIDKIVADMRRAMLDRKLSYVERRIAMQAHGDRLRTAIIELSQAMPVSSLHALALQFQGAQISPMLSSKIKVRQGQLQAIATVTQQLKIIGSDLEKRVGSLASAMETGAVLVYNPMPPSILTLKHIRALISVAATAIALDALILILYAFLARMHDALRTMREGREEWHDLTAHDLSLAAKARAHIDALDSDIHDGEVSQKGGKS